MMAQEIGPTCSSAGDLSTIGESSPSGSSVVSTQTSSSVSVAREDSSASGSGAVNASHVKSSRHKRKIAIKTLEKKLKVLDKHIKKCSEAELTFEEMESGASAYMKEDLYKRKFVATWKELCRLVQIPDNIEVAGLSAAVYSGTHYPEINRRVQRLIMLDEFPDYFDIVELIDRCDSKHNLSICAEEKQTLSKAIFKEVGKIMKDRRQQEFISNFGNHLTDLVKFSDDPALQDSALCQQLLDSLQEGQEKMERMCDEFVDKQEQGLDTDRSSSGSEEEEEDEEPVFSDDNNLEGLDDVALDEGLDTPLDSPLTADSPVVSETASSDIDDPTVGAEQSDGSMESSEDGQLSESPQTNHESTVCKDGMPPCEVGSANTVQESSNGQEHPPPHHVDELAEDSLSNEQEPPPTKKPRREYSPTSVQTCEVITIEDSEDDDVICLD